MFGASKKQLEAERKHYAVIRSLTGQRLDAIQYLYGRLNIIDAKSASLLQVNGFVLAIMTFMTGSIYVLSNASDSIVNLAELAHAFFPKAFALGALGALTLLVLSTVTCFRIFALTFDHITIKSTALEKELGEPGEPGKRDAARLEWLDAHLKSAPAAGECSGGKDAPAGSLEQYEEMFFNVTMKRQNLLKWAARLTALSGLILAVAYGDYLFALVKL